MCVGTTFGKIADRIGALKSIKIILITWIVLFPGLGLVKTIPGLIICSTMLGFTMGGMVAVVRAYLSQKLKKEEFGYGFSFYTSQLEIGREKAEELPYLVIMPNGNLYSTWMGEQFKVDSLRKFIESGE